MSFKEKLQKQGLLIPYSDNVDVLTSELELYGKNVPNRIGILPLEGYDSKIDGTPSKEVYRRYLRFAAGGAGLIWFEACAVSDDGKSNPYQMMLRDSNVLEFKKLIEEMDKESLKHGRKPSIKVLQLTHSGRVSKDNEWNEIPISPKRRGDGDNAKLASDDRISKMIDEHIHAAVLAAKAGFDAVDVKVCHGYFLSELLSAFNREGKYGGSYENRTRAIFEIIDGIREKAGDKIGLSVRLNAFDSEVYPDGYGLVYESGKKKADLTECIRLCNDLRDRGVKLINISASTPSERVLGMEPSEPKYKKYASSCDFLMAVKLIKESVKDVCFMCTGLSSFFKEGGSVAAGGIEENWFDIAGFGRQALAYPDFAKDILNDGKLHEGKCCIDCGKCFSLMDPGHCRTGCIVRDKEEIYPYYKKYVLDQN